VKALQPLRDYLQQTRLLASISSTLYFDQNTVMPAASAPWRGEQLALLAAQLHQRQTSDEYSDLLEAAESEASESEASGPDRNLELLRLELDRRRCLDPDLVGALTRAQSHGNAIWQEARRTDTFVTFAPALKQLINLRLEQASQLRPAEPPGRSAWEILAQPFEPDISKGRLEQLFAPLKRELPPLLDQVMASKQPAAAAPELLPPLQDQLCSELLSSWGYDPQRCHASSSAHPFSCTLGPNDFRITTRVVEGQPFSCFLAAAHEWGHSLYEQGLPRDRPQCFPWPLGDATSMGVHESQSLFWECRVARSQAFAALWYPRFCQTLTQDPWGCSDEFWRAFNPMRPGYIRVEADELSYCLHIVLRYELELALLEGGLPVEELPQQWNQRFEQLLGLIPTSDREGCLQDIHWAEGMFGYFPSYALGHLISAQLSEAMVAELGPLHERIAAGEEQLLRQWLGRYVWPLGRSVNAEQLVHQVSGAALSADPFLTYLRDKVERLQAPQPAAVS